MAHVDGKMGIFTASYLLSSSHLQQQSLGTATSAKKCVMIQVCKTSGVGREARVLLVTAESSLFRSKMKFSGGLAQGPLSPIPHPPSFPRHIFKFGVRSNSEIDHVCPLRECGGHPGQLGQSRQVAADG